MTNVRLILLYGMVFYGIVWYGGLWYGMVWYGKTWWFMVWYGKTFVHEMYFIAGRDQGYTHAKNVKGRKCSVQDALIYND